MQLAVHRNATIAIVTLHHILASICSATIIPETQTTTAFSAESTCEFRIINYITDTLPQFCLKSIWSPSNGTTAAQSVTATEALGHEGNTEWAVREATSDATEGRPTAAASQYPSRSAHAELTSTSAAAVDSVGLGEIEIFAMDSEPGELNEASFLSFEEWKRRALEKAGQKGLDIGLKKSLTGSEETRLEAESLHDQFDSLGDDGEINLDFGGFGRRAAGPPPTQSSTSWEADFHRGEAENQVGQTRQTDQYRSKDAGKTCKERFSYASFDAGATILKTHSGAKNAKAVLVENKDSYMLSECAAENKFLIIELSEDIWIDTLVLANFEFFSSMIRTFRVSVSDRYPVKMDKWKDAGTYEARNSREIQAFLVENPQIWARYIRVEILRHYGNEYYCPLSLVRVHGTRMLESWKETEAANEEEEAGGADGAGSEQYVPDAIAEVIREEERSSAERKSTKTSSTGSTNTARASVLCSDRYDCMAQDATSRPLTSSWHRGHGLFLPERLNGVCVASVTPCPISIKARLTQDASDNESQKQEPHTESAVDTLTKVSSAISNTSSPTQQSIPEPRADTSGPTANMTAGSLKTESKTTQADINAISQDQENSKGAEFNSLQKNRTTSATMTSSNASPTQQESFFKAVTRRLQLLEANSTLSLKYIEEQSRILRDAFSKVEKKQLQKTTSFLQTINTTVFAELQGFRQQYDEIWQSTIISLQTQREESQREILAISSRLNILADEVVFQKRMTIVQSIILIIFLGLVVFSRIATSSNRSSESTSFSRILHTNSEYPTTTQTDGLAHGVSDRYYLRDFLQGEHQSHESIDTRDVQLQDHDRSDSPTTPLSKFEDSNYTTTSTLMRTRSGTLLRRVVRRSSSEQSPPRMLSYSGSSDGSGFSKHPSSSMRSPTRRNMQLSSPPASAISLEPQTPVAADFFRSHWVDLHSSPTTSPIGSSPVDVRSSPSTGRRSDMFIARKPLPALPVAEEEMKNKE